MRNATWTLLHFSALAATLAAITVTAHAQAQGSWTMKEPLPARLNEVSVAAADGNPRHGGRRARRHRPLSSGI